MISLALKVVLLRSPSLTTTVTVSLLCSFLSSVTVKVNSYVPTSRPVTVATALSAFSIFTPSGPLQQEEVDRNQTESPASVEGGAESGTGGPAAAPLT